ncbi:MAG TPA: hypothetical protein ENK19_09325, partial [Acidobacteria bacterium]|nr:hypothetical protein [Acidobacteriota bacterium]
MKPWEAREDLRRIIEDLQAIAQRMATIAEEDQKEWTATLERARLESQVAGLVPPPGKDVLTTKEAVALGYFSNREEACRLRKEGRGPRYIRRDRRVLYRRADLEAWIQ